MFRRRPQPGRAVSPARQHGENGPAAVLPACPDARTRKPVPDVKRSRRSASQGARRPARSRREEGRTRGGGRRCCPCRRRRSHPRGFESLAEDPLRWPAGARRRTRRPCDASAMVSTGGGPGRRRFVRSDVGLSCPRSFGRTVRSGTRRARRCRACLAGGRQCLDHLAESPQGREGDVRRGGEWRGRCRTRARREASRRVFSSGS